MHGWIRDRVEELLGNKRRSPMLPGEVSVHVSECQECSSELAAMSAQADLLKILRAPEGLEPAAGFYARVMQRIEERAKESIWASVVYSPLSSRIAYAALTMTVLLGTYVVTAESRDGHLAGSSELAATVHYDVPVTGDLAQQRNAVLQNFAVH